MLDVRFFHSAKIVALANRQKLGFIYVLCEAKQKDQPGVFETKAALLFSAGQFKDCLPAWLEAGVLHYGEAICDKCRKHFGEVPAAAVVVHDWHEYQEPSRTQTWRESVGLTSGHGNLRGNAGETGGNSRGNIRETPHARERASESLSSSESESTTEGVQGEPDAWSAFHARTGEVPGEKMRGWLDELSEAHGEARVVAMIGQVPKTQRSGVDYLKAVRDALRADDFEAERAERAAEKASVKAKRAPLKVVRPVDVSPEEARRLAEEYHAASKGATA